VAVGEAQDLCEHLHKQEALLQQELTGLQSKLEDAAAQLQSKEDALNRCVHWH
jgi:chromosome segregation ATPase